MILASMRTAPTPSVPAGGYFYFGNESTDGSWRFYVSGENLVVEKRESGVWVEKGSFLA